MTTGDLVGPLTEHAQDCVDAILHAWAAGMLLSPAELLTGVREAELGLVASRFRRYARHEPPPDLITGDG